MPGIFYTVILFIYNIECHDEDITELDFRDVIKQNKEYSPLPDRCHLRVYGGVTAEHGDIPYQVAIRKRKLNGRLWAIFCGGAIVTKKHVVTAAHCFDDFGASFVNKTRVIAGTVSSNIHLYGNKKARRSLLRELQTKETWRKIAECYLHADYSRIAVRHDFAVLLLQQPLEFSENIKPIPMINYNARLKRDTPCTTSGYGLMERYQPSSFLRYVCLPVVLFDSCKIYYPYILYSNHSQICAGSYGKDSCQGDSGGPMACQGILVGLVSFGGRCGEAPGVYTLLSAYTRGNKIPLVKNVSVNVNSDVIGLLVLLYIHICL